MKSPQQHLEDGMKKRRLKQSEHLVVKDSTTQRKLTDFFKEKNNQSKSERSFVMPESVVIIRKETLKDKSQRRIGSKAARAMATWGHYRFKQRLLHKSREYPWCKPIICDEHFTSKTCGQCGFIHDKLGSSKVFKCPQCQFTLDRDVNGARNILIRYLTLHPNTRVTFESR